jgi:hypothetical protein
MYFSERANLIRLYKPSAMLNTSLVNATNPQFNRHPLQKWHVLQRTCRHSAELSLPESYRKISGAMSITRVSSCTG